jgi:hypothetical protein
VLAVIVLFLLLMPVIRSVREKMQANARDDSFLTF